MARLVQYSHIPKHLVGGKIILSGKLTILSCPVNNPPGSIVVIPILAQNTGDINNNTFVICATAVRTDTGTIIESGISGNIDINIGQTVEWSISFIMPPSDVNIAFDLQADPNHNY